MQSVCAPRVAVGQHAHLLVHSLFDKLGNLLPGTQRDAHLLQVLYCAHELQEHKKIRQNEDAM